MRVLIVEDEPYLAEAVRDWLDATSIAADIVGDGEAGLVAVDLADYDVVLLDRDLPGMSGDELCRILAEREIRPAILMVTAARRLDEKVDGLGLGADDYLTKPFELAELAARVRALARRRFTPATPALLRRGELTVDPIRREVLRRGRYVRLSRKEFAVLEVLLRETGVVSAERLLEKAWDENANPFTNSVKVTISTLRRKLGEPWLIRTVPGVGYVIDEAS
jgi:two-component system response regulator VanR